MIDANITLNQLAQVSSGGAHRLTTMIGAKSFCKDDNSVSFRFMKGAKNKANHITIRLNSSDTYDVEFGRIHGFNYKVIDIAEGLYEDMLYSHFIEETGLHLKF